MAHYAILDDDNKVIQVFVGKNETDFLDTHNSWEEFYSELHKRKVLRTSYNTWRGQHLAGGLAFRKNYAGIGFTYDNIRDAFIPPPPFSNWVLDEETCDWEPPIPYPQDGLNYYWSEEQSLWISN